MHSMGEDSPTISPTASQRAIGHVFAEIKARAERDCPLTSIHRDAKNEA